MCIVDSEQGFMRCLLEKYYSKVFEVCRTQFSDENDAADCACSVFDDAKVKISVLKNHPNVEGWLFRATKICICRKQRSISKYENMFDKSYDIYTIPSTSISVVNSLFDDNDIANMKADVLNSLCDDEMRLYQLVYVEKVSADTISSKLGITKKALQMRIYRLNDKIRLKVNDIFC